MVSLCGVDPHEGGSDRNQAMERVAIEPLAERLPMRSVPAGYETDLQSASGRRGERVDAVRGIQPADFGIGGDLWPAIDLSVYVRPAPGRETLHVPAGLREPSSGLSAIDHAEWPTVPIATSYQGAYLDDIRAIICAYPWPCEQAMAVAMCESTMNPAAYNAGNVGLFQIHEPSHRRRLRDGESLFDVATNVRVAFEIWSDQAWIPWACKP